MKAVSKVQVPLLLRQRHNARSGSHNADLGLLYKSSIVLGAI